MSDATLFGLCARALVGLGLYGLIVNPQPLRKILAFNVVGSGVFLLFGAIARRGAAAGMGGDPVPQALLITGIVVAFSATALAVALLLRLSAATGTVTLATDPPPVGPGPRDRDSLSSQTADDDHSRRLLLVLAVLVPVRRRAARPGAGRTQCAARWRRSSCRSGWRSRSASPRPGCRPGGAVVYLLGGWAPPLGVALRADGLAVVMIAAIAVVVCGIGVYARADFGTPPARPRRARPSPTGCC